MKTKVGIPNIRLAAVLTALDELAVGELRPKFAFRVKSIYAELLDRYQKYVAFRNEQIEKLAEKDEDGNIIYVDENKNVRISAENIEALRELDEDTGEEVFPLKLSEMENSGIRVKVSTLFQLGDFVLDDTQ